MSISDNAIARMRSPSEMHIICIDITNKCDLHCSNCTRLLGQQTKFWDMTPENFRLALRSLAGFKGVIAMIGGNPCMHPKFAELCKIFEEEIPNKKQRGLWSNNIFRFEEIIAQTFGFFNLNPHDDPRGKESMERLKKAIPNISWYKGSSNHAPLLAASKDLFNSEEELWDAISHCDINREWSATLIQNQGNLRAYFCEVAASFDLARGTDHGRDPVPGWWNASITSFGDQVKTFCPGCGVPARLKPIKDSKEIDQYTESNRDLAEQSRRGRKLEPFVGEPTYHPVTHYNQSSAVVEISVVIPYYRAADTIRETVESVLAQKDAKFEIIIVADGCGSGIEELKHQLDGLESEYRFLQYDINGGPAKARNFGLNAAKGQFVVFLDSDDLLAPGFLSTCATALKQNPDMASVTTDIEPFNSHREISPQHRQCMVAAIPSNIMVRTEIAKLVGGFPEHPVFRGPSAGEDVVFKRLICGSFKSGFIAEPLLRYRIKPYSHFDLFMDSTILQPDGTLEYVGEPNPELDGAANAHIRAAQLAINNYIAEKDPVKLSLVKTPSGFKLMFSKPISELPISKETLEGMLDAIS